MNEKITELVIAVNKEGKVPEHLVDPMFDIHNTLFPSMKEFNKGCSTCRKRTFSRIQKYYNDNIL